MKVLFRFISLFFSVIRRLRNIWCTLYWRMFVKEVGENSKFYYGSSFNYPNSIIVGDDCLVEFGATFSSETQNGYLIMRNSVKINKDVFIDFTGGLEIGNNVVISKESYIITHSHGYDPLSKPIAKKLLIGENVWIGAKVIICENVSYIGRNSLIAAGSVVTKNVEDFTVVGGNPAKFIKSLIQK